MEVSAYEKLADVLDRLPNGFLDHAVGNMMKGIGCNCCGCCCGIL